MPDTSVKVEKRQDTIMDKKEKQARSFVLGDAVYVRDFSARDTQWIPGEITKVTGPRSYHVLLKDGKTIRQHIDNITKRVVSKNTTVIPKDTFITTPSLTPTKPPTSPPIVLPIENARPTAPTTIRCSTSYSSTKTNGRYYKLLIIIIYLIYVLKGGGMLYMDTYLFLLLGVLLIHYY